MTRLSISFFTVVLIVIFTATFSCTQQAPEVTWDMVQDTTDIVVSIEGFSGPEAVRYDPGQDVYFVSNFTGGGGDRDSTGFISRVTPGGTIDSLRFMTGTETWPLHAPRGMYITGDTLWACDMDGVHGFNRMTGEQLTFVDFTAFEPGFLNDIVEGADGNLYVTDTGKSAVYSIENGSPSIEVESLAAPPNGIAIDDGGTLVLAPWGGDSTFYSLTEQAPSGYIAYAEAESGGNFDGIEFVAGRMIAASQMDSSLHVLYEAGDRVAVHVTGRPADIGLDTRRRQIAVPYVDLDRVDIWQLPQ